MTSSLHDAVFDVQPYKMHVSYFCEILSDIRLLSFYEGIGAISRAYHEKARFGPSTTRSRGRNSSKLESRCTERSFRAPCGSLVFAVHSHGTGTVIIKRRIFRIENYNWRTQEALFNRLMPQYRAIITSDSSKDHGTTYPPLRMHYVHRRSRHATAIPLLFCHGWPGSFIEASKIIELLCDPISTPLNSCDVVAFHVVVPSIPGFGFGDPSSIANFGLRETADTFDALMSRLGYDKYVVHGTGWYVNNLRLCLALLVN